MLQEGVVQGNGKLESRDFYLYAEFGDFSEITEELRSENATRIFTGGVRINNSMYRTQEETEEYIEKSLRRKLP